MFEVRNCSQSSGGKAGYGGFSARHDLADGALGNNFLKVTGPLGAPLGPKHRINRRILQSGSKPPMVCRILVFM